MAGINLSQSSEKKRISGQVVVDQGLIILIVACLLVLAVWGGIRYYIYTVTQEMASLQESIDQSGPERQGEQVDRVTDISERLSHIEKKHATATDIPGLLSQLEKLTVPEVRITKYEYNKAEKIVHISGTTTNFRFVAQQILNLRQETPLENIQVEKLGNMDEGKITFVLKAALDQ